MMRLRAPSLIQTLELCLKLRGSRPTACYSNGASGDLKPALGNTCSSCKGQQRRHFHTRSLKLARGSRQVVNFDSRSQDASQDSEIVENQLSSAATNVSQVQEHFVLPSTPKGAKDEEIYEAIMKMKPKEIFYLLQHYHDGLNKTHFALSMKRLHRIHRNLPDESKEDYKKILHSQDGFKLLCALLALKGEHYEPPIVADMLTFMHELGLDSVNPTVQVYLHLLSHNLHRLTLDVIVKVMKCTVAMTPTPQVKLLKKGVGILAEKGQLSEGIRVLSAVELVQMLDLLGGFLPREDLKLLLKEISFVEDRISTRLCVPLLRGLRHSHLPHALEVEAINKIIAQTEKLSPDEVADVLESCWNIDLYHFELLNKAESEAVGKFDELNQFRVIKWLSKFGYLPKKLLSAVQKYPEKLVNTLNSTDLLILLDILSDGSHKVELHKGIMQLLVHKLEITDFSKISLDEKIRCLMNLHVLGQGHHNLADDLHKLLDNEEAVQHFMQSSPGKHDVDHPLWRLYMICLARNTHEPNVRLETSIIQASDECVVPSNVIAMGHMITSALETENCVVTRPRSKDKLLIDHVIVLDEKNKPVNLSGNRTAFLEDWDLEENHKIISVMELPGTCLHRNTRQLRGFYAWYMRQLQSRGHLVVLINTELFELVEDENKFEYIRRKIFSAEKFQDLVLIS